MPWSRHEKWIQRQFIILSAGGTDLKSPQRKEGWVIPEHSTATGRCPLSPVTSSTVAMLNWAKASDCDELADRDDVKRLYHMFRMSRSPSCVSSTSSWSFDRCQCYVKFCLLAKNCVYLARYACSSSSLTGFGGSWRWRCCISAPRRSLSVWTVTSQDSAHLGPEKQALVILPFRISSSN